MIPTIPAAAPLTAALGTPWVVGAILLAVAVLTWAMAAPPFGLWRRKLGGSPTLARVAPVLCAVAAACIVWALASFLPPTLLGLPSLPVIAVVELIVAAGLMLAASFMLGIKIGQARNRIREGGVS